jgi:hypothetical protein
MTEKSAQSVTFDTTLSAFGNNTGIELPPEVLEQLGAGKRPALNVEVNGFSFRTTAGVMKGMSLIPVNSTIRAQTGLAGGDAIQVTVTVDERPREVDMPDDFAEALAGVPVAQSFFAGLSNSLQRYHVDQVTSAKTDDTRQRRIAKAVALFVEGKQR